MNDTYYPQAYSIDAAAVVEALRSTGTPPEVPGNLMPPELPRETNMRELKLTSAGTDDLMINALEDPICSEDLFGAWVDFERLTIDVPLESAKSGWHQHA